MKDIIIEEINKDIQRRMPVKTRRLFSWGVVITMLFMSMYIYLKNGLQNIPECFFWMPLTIGFTFIIFIISTYICERKKYNKYKYSKTEFIDEDFRCQDILNESMKLSTSRERAFHFGYYLSKINAWSDDIKDKNKEEIIKIKSQYKFWREQEAADK